MSLSDPPSKIRKYQSVLFFPHFVGQSEVNYGGTFGIRPPLTPQLEAVCSFYIYFLNIFYILDWTPSVPTLCRCGLVSLLRKHGKFDSFAF